jgi:hypothetical protein
MTPKTRLLDLVANSVQGIRHARGIIVWLSGLPARSRPVQMRVMGAREHNGKSEEKKRIV